MEWKWTSMIGGIGPSSGPMICAAAPPGKAAMAIAHPSAIDTLFTASCIAISLPVFCQLSCQPR